MEHYERSKYEAQLDVRYGQCWNRLNERLFGRIDLLFGAITLFGGSAIAVTVTADHKAAAAWVGGIVAVSAIVERLVGATEKRLEHREMKKRFADLDARSGALSQEEIDAELRLLQADGPCGIRGLDVPAYNANLRTNGRLEAKLPVSFWNWLCAVLA
jgi:hypothetical protein